MSETQVQTCLEVTGNIVVTAMQSGKLPAEDADAVAAYFKTVYWQVFESAETNLADLRNRQSRRGT